MILTLSGLPGVGKSSIGKELAEYLHCPFIDLDQEIERKQRHTVTEIFHILGETAFRKIELETLTSIILNKRDDGTLVLSLGGGTPSIPEARLLLKEHCTNLYLFSNCEKIAEDILTFGTSTRPMFQGKDKEGVLALLHELKEKRENWYLEIADMAIDISDYQYHR